MSLLDENLYQKMRLILPQHRRKMEEYEYELSIAKREQPKISEDQYNEFSCIISEAILNESKIKLTVWGKYENNYITGVPVLNGSLRIRTENGIESVNSKLIINVSPIPDL